MFTKLQKYITKFGNTDKTISHVEPKCVRNAIKLETAEKNDNRQ
jgi:hypothetical protein